MVCSSSTTLATPSNVGRSNIVSINDCSMIERSPRAPVLRAKRLARDGDQLRMGESRGRRRPSKTASDTVSEARSSAPSEFRPVLPRSTRPTSQPRGRRPTNSGIRPNLIRSSGSTSRKTSETRRSCFVRTVAPKPMPDFSERFWITFSSPSNAPPQMKRILVVSICRKSWLGCFRPPCGGTEAMVPSTSFSKACLKRPRPTRLA